MLTRISNFSQADYIPDIPAHTTPLHVISEVSNVRIRANKLQKFRGGVYLPYTFPQPPRYIISGKSWWFVLGLAKLYKVAYGAVTDITGALTLNTGEATGWVGEIFNGVAVATNGVDNPIVWTGTGNATYLPNWPPGDVTAALCKTLRSFKNYLIAGNLTEDGEAQPNVIRWSHPADPGTLPVSWNILDTTKDAGKHILAETPGIVIDSLSLGDVHIIYKNDATYMLQTIGGAFVMKLTPLSLLSGMLRPNCATNIGHAHVVLSEDDVVMVTPQGVRSIVHNRIRANLFAHLSGSEIDKVFLAHNSAESEVWICTPVDSAWPNIAWVWNYREDKWYKRGLPMLAHADFGPQQEAGLLIIDATMLITDAPFLINNVMAMSRSFIGAAYASSKLTAFGWANSEFGEDMHAVVEHHSYDFAEQEGVSPEHVKLVTKIRPHFSVDTAPGTVVTFRIGSQMQLGDPISWSEPKSYVYGTTRDIYLRKTGRYISWRVSSQGQQHWELDGLDITYQLVGAY